MSIISQYSVNMQKMYQFQKLLLNVDKFAKPFKMQNLYKTKLLDLILLEGVKVQIVEQITYLSKYNKPQKHALKINNKANQQAFKQLVLLCNSTNFQKQPQLRNILQFNSQFKFISLEYYSFSIFVQKNFYAELLIHFSIYSLVKSNIKHFYIRRFINNYYSININFKVNLSYQVFHQVRLNQISKKFLKNQMKAKQATPNNLLKKLYAFTQNKQKAFKKIIPIHKNIFKALQHAELTIEHSKIDITTETNEYKRQNRLVMDQKIMSQCVSIYDVFLGKQRQKQKYNSKQKDILKRQQMRKLSKQKSEKSIMQKQIQYAQKMKIWQQQKQRIDEKKRLQQLKKLEQIKDEQQKLKRIKQKEQQKIKQGRKKKLEQGLKKIQQRRKKRGQMVKQLSQQKIRSKSMKLLAKNGVPKYIELEKQYLEKQRKQQQDLKQMSKQKRQSMQLNLQQIKLHQKQYLQKIKQIFTSRSRLHSASIKSRKAKSDFNVIQMKDEQQQAKLRSRVHRRKQFQSKLRNIPIHIDPLKKKQKEIQVDKLINKQKYMLLANKHINEDQIFTQFKDFQVKVNPKQLGKNYLNQLRLVPKSQKRGQSTDNIQKNEPPKQTYANYLEQLRLKNAYKTKIEPIIQQKDQLLKLVQKSKKILKKNYQQQQNIQQSRFSLKNSQNHKKDELPMKIRENQIKAEVAKSITEKISEYQRKVYQKVNDLKKISEYDDSLKYQNEIDDLYSKVLRGKLATLDLS